MSYLSNYTISGFKQKIAELREQEKVSNQGLVQEVESYCSDLNGKLNREGASWQAFKAF